jgi:hypothetical protein
MNTLLRIFNTLLLVGILATLIIVCQRLPRSERSQTPPADMRYEMQLTRDGEIIRLDRQTGTLHVVTGKFVGDLPESLAAQEKH